MQPHDSSATLWLFVGGGLFLGAVLAVVLTSLRIAQQKREFTHAERLRSLELGMPLGAQTAWPAAVCIAIGACVPVGSMLMALLASLVYLRENAPGAGFPFVRDENRIAFLGLVWGTSSLVGLAGVVAGSILALRLLSRRPHRELEAGSSHGGLSAGKVQFDPDSYDTVGRRG